MEFVVSNVQPGKCSRNIPENHKFHFTRCYGVPYIHQRQGVLQSTGFLILKYLLVTAFRPALGYWDLLPGVKAAEVRSCPLTSI